MKDRNNNALKAGIWYTFSNFMIRGISIITMPIFTRLMTKGEIGDFSAFTGWISILSVIVTLNLGTTVIIAKYDFTDRYDEYCSSVSFLGFLSCGIVYLLALVLNNTTLSILGIKPYELHVMFLYLMFMPSMDIILGKFRTELKYKPAITLSVTSTVLATIGALICVYFSSDRLMGRVLGTYVPQIIICICIFFFLLAKGKSINKKYWGYALSISSPLIIHNLSGNIVQSSDRIMIQRLCSSEDAAIYSVAFMCGFFANVVRNSMEAAWTPWVFEQISADNKDRIRKIGKVYVLFFCLICLTIIFLAPEILNIMGGADYLEAKYVVPPVVGGYMFSMLYSLYGGIERYYKEQKWFAPFAVITASVNVVLNLIFIQKFGYIAAAYTTMVSCAIELILHFNNTRRLEISDYYDGMFTLKCSIIIILITVFSEVLYTNNVLRIIALSVLILIVFVACVKHRNQVCVLVERFFNRR